MNILLKNAHIIDPASGIDSVLDMLIVNGVIEKIAPKIRPASPASEYDLNERIAAPGFIDMHVHLREPGFEYKETVESGCRAAAAGGFTSVCCMPNTDPAIDDASVVRFIRQAAARVDGGLVDVYCVGAVTKGRAGKELSPMLELAQAGAVAFSDDGSPVESAEMMRRALDYASMTGKPVIQHAEETALTRGGVMNEGIVSTSLGLPPMPDAAEEIMVARDIRLAECARAQYHVAHISTAGSVDLVRSAKRKGLAVSCEVTPHHFCLTEDAVRSYDTNTKMNPPLRTREDVEAILEALRDGTIDVIATDHAPHSFDEKQVEYVYAPFGIVGLETAVGLAITRLVDRKIVSLAELIEKLSVNPRRILHLPPVRVAEGERASLTVLDPALEWVVDAASFKSKSKNSPFDKWKLKGKPLGILNNSVASLSGLMS